MYTVVNAYSLCFIIIATVIAKLNIRRTDCELIDMKDCMAYGERTAPLQQNPSSELVVYASIN